jgi:hypothetical protein
MYIRPGPVFQFKLFLGDSSKQRNTKIVLVRINPACHFHAMICQWPPRRSWRAAKLPDQAFSVVKQLVTGAKHLVLAWGLAGRPLLNTNV